MMCRPRIIKLSKSRCSGSLCSWVESTAAAIEAWKPGAEGRRLASAWADASSVVYRADYTVEQAIEDIVILESLSGKKPAAIKVEAGEANTTRLKTYLSAPHTLTELLPVMQNMGLVVCGSEALRVQA